MQKIQQYINTFIFGKKLTNETKLLLTPYFLNTTYFSSFLEKETLFFKKYFKKNRNFLKILFLLKQYPYLIYEENDLYAVPFLKNRDFFLSSKEREYLFILLVQWTGMPQDILFLLFRNVAFILLIQSLKIDFWLDGIKNRLLRRIFRKTFSQFHVAISNNNEYVRNKFLKPATLAVFAMKNIFFSSFRTFVSSLKELFFFYRILKKKKSLFYFLVRRWKMEFFLFKQNLTLNSFLPYSQFGNLLFLKEKVKPTFSFFSKKKILSYLKSVEVPVDTYKSYFLTKETASFTPNFLNDIREDFFFFFERRMESSWLNKSRSFSKSESCIPIPKIVFSTFLPQKTSLKKKTIFYYKNFYFLRLQRQLSDLSQFFARSESSSFFKLKNKNSFLKKNLRELKNKKHSIHKKNIFTFQNWISFQPENSFLNYFSFSSWVYNQEGNFSPFFFLRNLRSLKNVKNIFLIFFSKKQLIKNFINFLKPFIPFSLNKKLRYFWKFFNSFSKSKIIFFFFFVFKWSFFKNRDFFVLSLKNTELFSFCIQRLQSRRFVYFFDFLKLSFFQFRFLFFFLKEKRWRDLYPKIMKRFVANSQFKSYLKLRIVKANDYLKRLQVGKKRIYFTYLGSDFFFKILKKKKQYLKNIFYSNLFLNQLDNNFLTFLKLKIFFLRYSFSIFFYPFLFFFSPFKRFLNLFFFLNRKFSRTFHHSISIFFSKNLFFFQKNFFKKYSLILKFLSLFQKSFFLKKGSFINNQNLLSTKNIPKFVMDKFPFNSFSYSYVLRLYFSYINYRTLVYNVIPTRNNLFVGSYIFTKSDKGGSQSVGQFKKKRGAIKRNSYFRRGLFIYLKNKLLRDNEKYNLKYVFLNLKFLRWRVRKSTSKYRHPASVVSTFWSRFKGVLKGVQMDFNNLNISFNPKIPHGGDTPSKQRVVRFKKKRWRKRYPKIAFYF